MNGPERLRKLFPNASQSLLARNHNFACESSSAQPEQAVCHVSVAKETRKERHASRVRVHVTSFRRRLLDPDNLCPKYFVDCLRYAGYVPDDRPQDILLEVTQEKVKSFKEERTEIEISNITETKSQ